jgi:hypothetical protein
VGSQRARKKNEIRKLKRKKKSLMGIHMLQKCQQFSATKNAHLLPLGLEDIRASWQNADWRKLLVE